MKGYKHGKTRVLAAIMALLLCIVSLPMTSITAFANTSGNDANVSSKWTAHASAAFAGGSGSPEDPYQIATAEQLALLASDNSTYKDKSFKLTADINLSAHEWVPIANFSGNLDGAGYSIKGLRIGTEDSPSETTSQYIGLFAQASGTIRNLTIGVEFYISGSIAYRVGAVAGWFTGTIDNCNAEGVMNVVSTYQFMLGGFVGNTGATAKVLNSGNYVNIIGTGSGLIGGIVGVQGSDSTGSIPVIMNCYNAGAIHGKDGAQPRVAGIVGVNNSTLLKIYNCYNLGTVLVTNNTSEWGTSYGHIAGKNLSAWSDTKMLYGSNTALTQNTYTRVICTSEVEISSNEMKTQAFVDTLNTNVTTLTSEGVTGLMNWTLSTDDTPVIAAGSANPVPETVALTVTVTGSEFGSVKVETAVSGGGSYVEATGSSPYTIEKDSNVKITFTPGTNCESVTAPEGSVEQTDGSFIYTITGIVVDTTVAVEFKGIVSTKWTDYASASFSGGDGTTDNPYQISEAAELALLAKDSVSESPAYTAKCFKLTDNIDLSDYEWLPIKNFSGTFDGNDKRLTGLKIGTEDTPATDLQGKDVGLFGAMSGLVKNLTVNAAIYVSDASNWEATAIVVGNLSGTLDHCFAEGIINVTRLQAHVGGVAGYVGQGGRVFNCGNKAAVYGSGNTTAKDNTRVGGIAGSLVIGNSHNKSLLVANCYNVGTITATGGQVPLAGGIIGWLQNNSSDQESYQISVYNCYNAGMVDITGSTVKGKVGNITAYTFGKINTAYLYGVSEKLSTGDHVSAVVTCAEQTDLLLVDMKAADFAESLTIHADALVRQETCEKVLLGWEEATDTTPTFSDTLVQGNMITLGVKVNSSRLGSVKVLADEAGGTNYTEVTKKILNEGSKVQLIIQPTAGCQMTALHLNGTEQTVSGNTFEFILSDSSEIEVVFEVTETVNVDSIYVNPTATENGIGTEASPFKTLEQAKEEVQDILDNTPNANITVYLMGGTYLLEETFALGNDDTSLGRITYKNYNDETPVITSGHTIAGNFEKVQGKEYYSYQLPAVAKVGNTWPQFRDLYVNGKRAEIARTEEFTFKHTYANSVYGSATSATTVVQCDNLLYLSPDALAGIDSTNFDGVELGQLVEWDSVIFHIGSITGKTLDGEVEITLDEEEWGLYYVTNTTKKSLVGRKYWLQNHMNFLDAPGEFYYDQANGTIYYYPLEGQSMEGAIVEYATLDTLINMENAANITLDGITFTGTTANYITENGLVTMLGCTLRFYEGDEGQHMPFAAVKGKDAEGIEVSNCIFKELSGPAMVFNSGIKDLQITGNVIKDIAMAGIQVGRNQLWWNEGGIPGASEDVTISNNYITNIGTLTLGAPAIRVARCKNLSIQYNTIIHVPYSAIMTGYGWNTSNSDKSWNTNLINADISYNYIEDYLYKINDGSAIYTCGANGFITDTEYMNEIHHNYIRAGAHNGTYIGIYHDGSASNWHTHDNVIDDLKSKKGPIFFQDDVPTQYTHNILADNNYTTVSLITQNGSIDKDGNPRNIALQNNTMVADRSKLSAEAIAIMNGAGLQDGYKHLESPMDVELRIADNTMHYVVNKKQTSNIKMQIELTNNSAEDKVYTLSITDALPAGINLIINSGNAVSVESRKTKIVNAEFVVTDANKVVDTEDFVVGFEVTDADQRVVSYPRTFTIKTISGNVAGEIPYGTPTVDGILDEAYLNGTLNFFGPVFHPDTYTETDISGGYYMLWDENYLYCYVIVNESTVMSRGTEWIASQIASGNQGNLWESDAVETYIKVPTIRNGNSKFAVDAFGIQRFGNANISLEHHNLPYATKFTYNGEIIEKEIPETIAAGQTATEAMGTDVNGYVVEMTLPITLLESIINSDDGKPSAGDTVDFYIQNNDYRGTKPDGSIYTVAQANEMSAYTLKAKEEAGSSIEIEVNNIGKATSDVIVTAPTGGWVEGINTFTVSSEKACVVAVKNTDGTYSPVAAVATETKGIYSYTVEDMTAETEIVVALSGDANGDGKVSNADITKLRAACAGKATLDGIQTLLGDVNGNGKVTNADITRLRAACAGKKALNW